MDKNLDNILYNTHVKYKRIRTISNLVPINILNFCENENCLIIPNNSTIFYGNIKLLSDEILFIPSGINTALKIGIGKYKDIKFADRKIFKESFFKKENFKEDDLNFTVIFFEAKILDIFEFFNQFNLSVFSIKKNEIFLQIIITLILERKEEQIGFKKYLNLESEKLFIEIIRNLQLNNEFLNLLDTQKVLFQDERILKIFQYIKENINKDLSNAKLAEVALISEEYITHFFKRIVGISPQEFVENQRLEKSLEYLRNSKKSIGEIAFDSGYIDAPYFCKPFKLKYGVSPGKMRKLED